jgi:hypothetical protein
LKSGKPKAESVNCGELKLRQQRISSLMSSKRLIGLKVEGLGSELMVVRRELSSLKHKEEVVETLGKKEKRKLLTGESRRQYSKLLALMSSRNVGLAQRACAVSSSSNSINKMTKRDEASLIGCVVDVSHILVSQPFSVQQSQERTGEKGASPTRVPNMRTFENRNTHCIECRVTLPHSQESIRVIAMQIAPGQVEIRLLASTQRGQLILQSREVQLKKTFGKASHVRIQISPDYKHEPELPFLDEVV